MSKNFANPSNLFNEFYSAADEDPDRLASVFPNTEQKHQAFLKQISNQRPGDILGSNPHLNWKTNL